MKPRLLPAVSSIPRTPPFAAVWAIQPRVSVSTRFSPPPLNETRKTVLMSH